MMPALIIVAIIEIALLVFMCITFWKILEKAGEPGWAIFIPIYGAIVMLRVIGKPWWWIFLMCIPLVNIYFLIVCVNQLSKAFGKDVGFTCGLLFLGIIFYPLLAFGDAKYIGPNAVPDTSGALDQMDGMKNV